MKATTTTLKAAYEGAYAVANTADDTFAAALDAEYGERRGDARYDVRRNRATPALREAYDNFQLAINDLTAAWHARQMAEELTYGA